MGTQNRESGGTEAVGRDDGYSVNVTNYARYDDGDDAAVPAGESDAGQKGETPYDDSVRRSLAYASRTPFARFLGDLICVLSRPGHFWASQDEHPATIAQVHVPHLFVLILLRTAAIITGGVLDSSRDDVGQIVVLAAVQGVMFLVLVWAFALCAAGISAIFGARFSYGRALRLSAYSASPIIIAGLIGVIPVPHISTICDLLSMPWAFVVLGAGVLPFMHAGPERAPVLAGLLCGVLLCLWGAVPILIPYLMSLAGSL